ncbi:MAG: indolepyruvate oxidoreductase subunit beta, partial [Gemmatimonadota bacterium]|nr:indolepyruvate oxidoreductase subunit beta [Gemmatimonadota bacterium]
MNHDTGITNVLLAGVGGQGIILASEVLCQAALIEGLDVKKSEVHGMSQRGGAVNSHVRFSQGKVFSPLIPAGQARFLVAMEKLEALRWEHFLAPGGTILVNDFRLDPASVACGKVSYTDDAIGRLRAKHADRVIVADGPALALEAGNPRVMNTVILGLLSNYLPFSLEHWQEALADKI